MLPSDLLHELRAIVGAGRVRTDAPLAPLTTFRVGGPADCLVEVRTGDELASAASAARRLGVPLTIVGGGSNLVVSDRGIRGVVLRVHGGRAQQLPGGGEDAEASALVQADSGVTMNELVRWTIARGLAGLEAWAGTPGTVGGAVFGNAHYSGTNIADLVVSVRFLPEAGDPVEWDASRLAFAYDTSRFQQTRDVILSAVFRLGTGAEPARLREVARESLAFRKRTQPLNAPSAGCAFQNPDPDRDIVPPGIPASAGALVDRAGLKGRAIGGASVSPVHANFIVSDGSATAADIRALVRLCHDEVLRQFGVDLRDEIRWMGEF
jgi:UDP-N-acetylmuramate dehydrogenase